MEHEHLDNECLEHLLALDRTEVQNRSLLHQIAVCPQCRKAGGWLLDLYRSGALRPLFGVSDVALARSRAEAPALWERLEWLPQKKRLGLVRATHAFASWGLAELLGRMSLQATAEATNRAVELAELAVAVAESVEDDEPAEPRWAYQLRALAWGCLSNARRVAGDLPGGEQACEMSDSWWEAGAETIGDALGYQPVLQSLKASLRIAQSRFDEALLLLDQAAETYLTGDPEHRDPHLAGRTLVKKAHALIEMGETERAVSVLKEAEPLIDPQRESRLLWCLRHNLVDNLTKAGRHDEAKPLLPGLWDLVRAHGNQLDRVRVRWVEARIAAGLGERAQGRQALFEVRQEFLRLGIAFDAAVATLELSALYLEDGNAAEVKALVAEIVDVFEAQTVHREALAAILIFQRAAEKETATVSLAWEIAGVLQRAHILGRPSEED